MPGLVEPVTCHRCNAPGQQQLFCQNCGLYLPDETGSTERVTFTRRFFGDQLLEALLFIFTLIIGWVIWFAFTASTAQSPAKRMLNVYVIDTNTGKAVSGGRMWLRDPLVKFLLVGNVIPFGGLISGIMTLADSHRQSLHDKIVSTIVVYAPMGLPESMRSTATSAAFSGATAAGATVASSIGTEPVGDVAERLRELARLRDEGILTPEEYEQKRSELAGRL